MTIVDVSGATFNEARAWAQEESGDHTLVAIAPATDIEVRMSAEMTVERSVN